MSVGAGNPWPERRSRPRAGRYGVRGVGLAAVSLVAAAVVSTYLLSMSRDLTAQGAGSHTVAGTIYEDVDGDGDHTSGTPAAGVDVWLFRDDGDGVPGIGDVLAATTTTDGAGVWSFVVVANTTYWAIVDSGDLVPAAGFNAGYGRDDVWAEQTYGPPGSARFDGTAWSFTTADGPVFGGKDPAVADGFPVLTAAEHLVRAEVSGSNITGLDLGFSFAAITTSAPGPEGPSTFADVQSWDVFDPRAGGVASRTGYVGTFFDGRYVYLSPFDNDTQHGEVLRYDSTGDFADPSAWAAFEPELSGVGVAPRGYTGLAHDGRYVYFAPYSRVGGGAEHGEVLRYDSMGDFDDAASWEAFDPGNNGVGVDPDGFFGATFDGRYVYFAPFFDGSTYRGEVLRLDTTLTFTDPASWTAYDPGDHGVGTDPDGYAQPVFDGRYLYFAPHYNGTDYHAEVLRFDTTMTFTDPASWTTYDPGAGGVGTAPRGFYGAAFDGRHVYLIPYNDGTGFEGDVLRYDTRAPFAAATSWTSFDPGATGVLSPPGGFTSASFDGRHLYLIPGRRAVGVHRTFLRYDVDADFADPNSWVTFDPAGAGLGADPDQFNGGAFDGRYSYFAPFGHSEVVRLDSGRVGQGTLDQFLDNATAIAGPQSSAFALPITDPAHLVGTWTLQPTATIALGDGTTLDATTQPGWAGDPVVVLDGTVAAAGDGVTMAGPGSAVRGLSITNWVGNGVAVLAGEGHTVADTTLVANGALGLDLGGDGITVNDAGDADAGPNGLLNHPELTAADGATVTFDLDVPTGHYRIDVFTNPGGADPSGSGEAERIADSAVVAHAGAGAESFTAPVLGLALGDVVTATATTCGDPSCSSLGSTSELSAPVTAAALASGTVFVDADGDGAVGLGEGVPGVELTLFLDEGDGLPGVGDVAVATTTSGPDGAWQFTVDTPGTYFTAVDGDDVAQVARLRPGVSIADVPATQTVGPVGSVVDATDTTRALSTEPGPVGGGRRPGQLDGYPSPAAAQHVVRTDITAGSFTQLDIGFSFSAVTHGGDSGPGSLRQALANSVALADPGPIRFALTDDDPSFGGGSWTLRPTSALLVQAPTVVDGASQAGWAGSPVVVIDGSALNGPVLTVSADAELRELTIANAGTAGIVWNSGSGSLDGVTVTTSAGDGIVVTGGSVGIDQPELRNIAGLAIDLGDDGVTVNDAGDADVGPNELLNHPVIDGVQRVGEVVTTTATLDVGAGIYLVQWFATDPPTAGKGGEAHRLLDETVVVAAGGPEALSIVVTDASLGAVTATASRCADATCTALEATSELAEVVTVNQAPTITPLVDRTLSEGDEVTVAVEVVDPDGDPVRLSLAGLPPSVVDGGPAVLGPDDVGVWSVTVTADDGRGGTAADTVIWDVRAAPAPPTPAIEGPTWTDPGPLVIDEGETLSVALEALGDGPVAYDLVDGPAAATIDVASGVLMWPTDETTGPRTIEATVTATDATGSSTLRVTVTVRELNDAPVITAPSPVRVEVGQDLELRLEATDSDVPANQLTWSLQSAPDGATIEADGTLIWPDAGPLGRHRIEVAVTDDGDPARRTVVDLDIDVTPTVAGPTLDPEPEADPEPAEEPDLVAATIGESYQLDVIEPRAPLAPQPFDLGSVVMSISVLAELDVVNFDVALGLTWLGLLVAVLAVGERRRRLYDLVGGSVVGVDDDGQPLVSYRPDAPAVWAGVRRRRHGRWMRAVTTPTGRIWCAASDLRRVR